MEPILTAKIVAMVLTGIIPIILGLIPWKAGKHVNRSNRWHQIIISFLLCFGGGVLIGLSLLHMLPEVRESLEVQFPEEEQLAETFLCVGFFLIYLIEELVHTVCGQGHGHGHSHETTETIGKADETVATTTALEAAANDDDQAPLNEEEEKRTNSAIRDFLTCLALSLHAVFEGLAVGLENTKAGVWTLYAGVAMHKYILSFCVGLELFTGKQNKFIVNFGYLFLYAIMSPVGIAIGITVTEVLEHDSTAFSTITGVLEALAAGTLVYVAVFEVLQREKAKKKVPGLLQFIAVIAGFTVILLFVRFGPEV